MTPCNRCGTIMSRFYRCWIFIGVVWGFPLVLLCIGSQSNRSIRTLFPSVLLRGNEVSEVDHSKLISPTHYPTPPLSPSPSSSSSPTEAYTNPPMTFSFAPDVNQPLVVSIPPASRLPFFVDVDLPGALGVHSSPSSPGGIDHSGTISSLPHRYSPKLTDPLSSSPTITTTPQPPPPLPSPLAPRSIRVRPARM
ncbi:hypothetical protein M427DRAFT_394626 [Gonapodya prolifera JEL478]|uniref:Uncharacterized protein n=1 Tax=Gonapodya prolifera (strain JEL478) TaxID=1344416 RepID=A0A139A757_GONPJ|nr:hypothetical protein M427DRAFT_394626 [Gonapodya prolifera JEL478]|eukprot:KXS12488.1 hypothetical protein M427DRAFT_394626 [Gonapodya prolifera JEL478]